MLAVELPSRTFQLTMTRSAPADVYIVPRTAGRERRPGHHRRHRSKTPVSTRQSTPRKSNDLHCTAIRTGAGNLPDAPKYSNRVVGPASLNGRTACPSSASASDSRANQWVATGHYPQRHTARAGNGTRVMARTRSSKRVSLQYLSNGFRLRTSRCRMTVRKLNAADCDQPSHAAGSNRYSTQRPAMTLRHCDFPACATLSYCITSGLQEKDRMSYRRCTEGP